jgi:hypothetical protein
MVIKVDTEKLLDYAGRLGSVNRSLYTIDNRLNSLYRQVGLLGLLNLLRADARIGWNKQIDRSEKYLRNTADEFVRTEREINQSYISDKNGFLFNDSSVGVTKSGVGTIVGDAFKPAIGSLLDQVGFIKNLVGNSVSGGAYGIMVMAEKAKNVKAFYSAQDLGGKMGKVGVFAAIAVGSIDVIGGISRDINNGVAGPKIALNAVTTSSVHVASAVGAKVGASTGAKIGAAIGSVFPGPGTVVGAVVGGAVGAVIGSGVGKNLAVATGRAISSLFKKN